MSSTHSPQTPLRWVGGKRWLVPALQSVFASKNCARFVDPFVGGASTAFVSPPGTQVISDVNADLVNFLRVSTRRPRAIIDHLSAWDDSAEVFSHVRAMVPRSKLEQASRFLYLNRTSFLGIYRVNRKGHYNVPYGGGGRLNHDALNVNLRSLSRQLRGASIDVGDFRTALADLRRGDLVFLDPPYRIQGDTVFGRYSATSFGWTDHLDMNELVTAYTDSGVICVSTLPASPDLIARYSGWCIVGARSNRTMPSGEVLLASEPLAELRTNVNWSCEPRKIPSSKVRVCSLLNDIMV
ncbi:Dam family site-specific DNA-(adenine-N6)-methyltransferase [Mycobacterium sp. 20091114027_K0903767]|nr:Dam family site-specific DNA-(adenine-N6)-methyltransferase [Mycobacterium sp. 20091114027_K0903767]